jgi:hypothetical protein
MRSIGSVKNKRDIKSIEDFIVGKWYIVLDDNGSNRILFQYSHYEINNYGAYICYHIYDLKGSYFYDSKRYDYEKGVPIIWFMSGGSEVIRASYVEVNKYFNV